MPAKQFRKVAQPAVYLLKSVRPHTDGATSPEANEVLEWARDIAYMRKIARRTVMIEMNRRGLITGVISLFAAPAIVRATSLMPVKALKPSLTIEEWAAMTSSERLVALHREKKNWLDAWDESARYFVPKSIRTSIPAPTWRLLD